MRVATLCVLAVVLLGCDPPCKEYWSAMCDHCGAHNSGCETAKDFSKAALKESGACQRASSSLKEALATPDDKKKLCKLPVDDGPPTRDVLGKWSCNGVPIELGLNQMRVGEASFEVVQFSNSFLNVAIDANHQTSCYPRGDGRKLHIRCLSRLDLLPAGNVECARVE
jgi:hypothetical protein